jgi:hypothetical protein
MRPQHLQVRRAAPLIRVTCDKARIHLLVLIAVTSSSSQGSASSLLEGPANVNEQVRDIRTHLEDIRQDETASALLLNPIACQSKACVPKLPQREVHHLIVH